MENIQSLFKHTKNKLSLVGVSVKEGQKLTGVEQTPDLFREGGFIESAKHIGWDIKDLGNLTRDQFQAAIDEEIKKDVPVKFKLPHIEIIGTVNKRLAEINHLESKEGRFVLNVGGDHGLASGTITGIRRTHPNLRIIWIDAHGDCNTPATSPSGNYHGMPAAHIFGWIKPGDVKAFDWLDVHVKTEHIVYVGLRDLDEAEKLMLKVNNIKFYTPYDIDNMGGIKFVMDEALKYLQADEGDNNPIHISFDVDGCDPSYIFGTGTKARCGLTERESHYLLQRVAKTGNLVSMDLVEVNPALDPIQERLHYHGDNPRISGCPSVANSIELTLSALGFSWR
jgi:arginase